MNNIHPTALCSLISLVFFTTTCTPQISDCTKPAVFCIGLVTAFAGIHDGGLNQAAWESLLVNQSNLDISRADYIESIDARDWKKNIAFFADKGYDVIITVGNEIKDATTAIAVEYPQTSFIAVDQQIEKNYPNIASITFYEEHAGFLAGVLAAMVTETNIVGAVCETSGIPTVWRYCEGFRAGAKYIHDDIQVFVAYREGESRHNIFNDPYWGRYAAMGLIQDDADILFAFGGRTAEGAYLEAAEHNVLVISAEYGSIPYLSDLQPVLLTNIEKAPDTQLSALLALASQGQFPPGSFSGEFEFTPLNFNPKSTSNNIEVKLREAYEALKTGEIVLHLPISR